MARSKDLNALRGYFVTGTGINNESGYDFALEDYGCCEPQADVEVIFEDIESRLLKLIRQSDVVVGCVAWLTNFTVLDALSECAFVNLVVQKEDYLRNDTSHPDRLWAERIRGAYGKLRGKLSSMNVPDISIDHEHFNHAVQRCCVRMDGMWTHPNQAVRCIGYGNGDRNRTPKMHHKFLVFCQNDPDVDLVPFAVWTGSYNLSHNAERSRENVVVIRSHEIQHAYLAEWAQLWALSEELDWVNEAPAFQELYVGT